MLWAMGYGLEFIQPVAMLKAAPQTYAWFPADVTMVELVRVMEIKSTWYYEFAIRVISAELRALRNS